MISYLKAKFNELGQYVDFDGKAYDVVFLDFETFYGTKYTLTSMPYYEYAHDERFKFHGVGIAINHGKYRWITEDDMEDLYEIDWDNVVLVCQNALFDALLLLWKFGIRAKFYHDTKSFSRAIFPGQKADLGFMLMREFPDDPDMWKGKEIADFKNVRDLNPAQEKIMAQYCGRDVNGMRALWYRWIGQMPYSELRIQHETLDLYLTPKFRLNVDMLDQALLEEEAETKALIKKSGYPKTTLSSNQKFADLLTSLGLEIPQKISPTTQEVIPALAQSDPAYIRFTAEHPEHKALWDARRAAKSTGGAARARRMKHMAQLFDGQIPVPLNYAGAHTLRWSGAEKVNFQSMKRGSKLRKSLEAPPGYLVYVVDSSNIEARKVSWLAGEDSALQMFRLGIDTYNDMATKIYGYEVDRKAKDEEGNKIFEEEGNVGKTARLGLGFGMGDRKFQYTLAAGPMGAAPIYKPLEFCTMAVNIFRSENMRIVQYWKLMQEAVYNMMMPGTHYYLGPLLIEYEKITFPNGLSLKYPNIRYYKKEIAELLDTGEVVRREDRRLVCDRKDGDTLQHLYGGIVTENVTQRGARDVVAEQTLEVIDYFQDVRTALLVHDEGVFIMPDDHPEERCAELERIYSTARDWCPDLPLAAETGYDICYSK